MNTSLHRAERSYSMKYSIAVLFTTIAWSVTCVLAQTCKSPTEKVIQQKLNSSWPEFIEKCQTHKGVVEGLTKVDDIATKIINALAKELVKGAEKSPKIDDKSWDELISDYCLDDVVIKILNESNAHEINECFYEEDKLKGEKKTDFTNALLEAYCDAVKTLAKEMYAADKD